LGLVIVKLRSFERPARFVETARALGCDEDKERFEAKLPEIARAKLKKRLQKKWSKSLLEQRQRFNSMEDQLIPDKGT